MNIKRYRLGRLAGLAVMVSALGLTGCDFDSLLDVDDRDTLNREEASNPDVAPAAVTGAIGSFVEAYSGDGGDAYISVSGLLGDELVSTGTFNTRTATDRRAQRPIPNGNTSDAAYNDLQFARRALVEAQGIVAAANDDDVTGVAQWIEVKALEALTYVTLAEGYCSGIPISSIDDNGEFVYGPPQTSEALLNTAVSLANEAIAAADGDPVLESLPALVKARAQISLGQSDLAAAAVANVDTYYAYFTYHSETAANNPIYSLQGNGRYSMASGEGNGPEQFYGGTGVEFLVGPAVGACSGLDCDPRTPYLFLANFGFDDSYDVAWSRRTWGFNEPIAIATGIEARLVEAEAAYNDGDYAGMVDILNNLRDQTFDLMFNIVPRYSEFITAAEAQALADEDLAVPAAGATQDAEALDMLYTERAYWLYLTGHRLGDLRRLAATYGVDPETIYPAGEYHKGGSYGTDVVLPMDFDEENNPEYDLSTCDVSSTAWN